MSEAQSITSASNQLREKIASVREAGESTPLPIPEEPGLLEHVELNLLRGAEPVTNPLVVIARNGYLEFWGANEDLKSGSVSNANTMEVFDRFGTYSYATGWPMRWVKRPRTDSDPLTKVITPSAADYRSYLQFGRYHLQSRTPLDIEAVNTAVTKYIPYGIDGVLLFITDSEFKTHHEQNSKVFVIHEALRKVQEERELRLPISVSLVSSDFSPFPEK